VWVFVRVFVRARNQWEETGTIRNNIGTPSLQSMKRLSQRLCLGGSSDPSKPVVQLSDDELEQRSSAFSGRGAELPGGPEE